MRDSLEPEGQASIARGYSVELVQLQRSLYDLDDLSNSATSAISEVEGSLDPPFHRLLKLADSIHQDYGSGHDGLVLRESSQSLIGYVLDAFANLETEIKRVSAQASELFDKASRCRPLCWRLVLGSQPTF
jgi:hypothetical protein